MYGDLLQPTELCNIYEISDKDSLDGTRYEVNPETIGQFTGLYDKNGKKIFEGDIVRVLGGIYEQGFYEINETTIVKDIIKDGYEIMTVISQLGKNCIEIIGNIHDNPELLEV